MVINQLRCASSAQLTPAANSNQLTNAGIAAGDLLPHGIPPATDINDALHVAICAEKSRLEGQFCMQHGHIAAAGTSVPRAIPACDPDADPRACFSDVCVNGL